MSHLRRERKRRKLFVAVLNSELRLLDSVRQMIVLLKEIFEAEVDVDKVGL